MEKLFTIGSFPFFAKEKRVVYFAGGEGTQEQESQELTPGYQIEHVDDVEKRTDTEIKVQKRLAKEDYGKKMKVAENLAIQLGQEGDYDQFKQGLGDNYEAAEISLNNRIAEAEKAYTDGVDELSSKNTLKTGADRIVEQEILGGSMGGKIDERQTRAEQIAKEYINAAKFRLEQSKSELVQDVNKLKKELERTTDLAKEGDREVDKAIKRTKREGKDLKARIDQANDSEIDKEEQEKQKLADAKRSAQNYITLTERTDLSQANFDYNRFTKSLKKDFGVAYNKDETYEMHQKKLQETQNKEHNGKVQSLTEEYLGNNSVYETYTDELKIIDERLTSFNSDPVNKHLPREKKNKERENITDAQKELRLKLGIIEQTMKKEAEKKVVQKEQETSKQFEENFGAIKKSEVNLTKAQTEIKNAQNKIANLITQIDESNDKISSLKEGRKTTFVEIDKGATKKVAELEAKRKELIGKYIASLGNFNMQTEVKRLFAAK